MPWYLCSASVENAGLGVELTHCCLRKEQWYEQTRTAALQCPRESQNSAAPFAGRQSGVGSGCSRFIVHWEIREAMKEADAEIVLQRAREKYPQARPQIISDNGPQFVAKDFKEFLRLWQTSHVFTSPHYPQSNGKLERYHRTLKEQAIRPKTPLTLEDAHRVVGEFVDHYNTVRLHSALGYVTPKDRLEGRHLEIQKARDQKLEAARRQRQAQRQAQQT